MTFVTSDSILILAILLKSCTLIIQSWYVLSIAAWEPQYAMYTQSLRQLRINFLQCHQKSSILALSQQQVCLCYHVWLLLVLWKLMRSCLSTKRAVANSNPGLFRLDRAWTYSPSKLPSRQPLISMQQKYYFPAHGFYFGPTPPVVAGHWSQLKIFIFAQKFVKWANYF